jgi:hypothetical protein
MAYPQHTIQPTSRVATRERASAHVTGASPHGPEVRKRLQGLIDARMRCHTYGWGRPASAVTDAAVRGLQQWLRVNPLPSERTLRMLWAAHQMDIRFVAPQNAAGKSTLRRLELLLTSL